MTQRKFNITGDDEEVAEKFREFMEIAEKKGALELCEPCPRKEIIEAILVDCFTFIVLSVIVIALLKSFSIWGIALFFLFSHTHNISYDQTNIFHKVIKKWRETQ